MKQILVHLAVTMIVRLTCTTTLKAVVDYGAAHAAKYGHHRYGRTYEGIMPDWAPGKNSFSWS